MMNPDRRQPPRLARETVETAGGRVRLPAPGDLLTLTLLP
jgi:hypothetical protein